MLIQNKIMQAGNGILRFFINDIPAKLVNASYNYYSMIDQGQLSMGLPISKKMLLSQEELEKRAAGKLALTVYHMLYRITGLRIPRIEIKCALLDDLKTRKIHLTENVILLKREELMSLIQNQLKIPKHFFHAILEEARRRKILKETLYYKGYPAYFESELEEIEQNGRGDYEIVYYREYTNEGKEIGYRRMASMEQVTAGDNRPSILMVPGLANNSNCFNINNTYSLAKDMADRSHWVYLFDPRGMGVNSGKFDPYYTVDTLMDTDLPTVLQSINQRSKQKPAILLGHSMGGILSENMVLNWGIKQSIESSEDLTLESKTILNQALPSIADVNQNIAMVKGIISLGSPKFFQKTSHIAFPIFLWINHITKIFRLHHVPVKEFIWWLTQPPIIKNISKYLLNKNFGDLNIMMEPKNHKEDQYFAHDYLKYAMESVPLGFGFQFLKAIYNGEGFKRMDGSKLNYSNYLSCFPKNIPLFHFWGTKDPLAPISNIRYSQYYPHKIKTVYHIKDQNDLKSVKISSEKSQVVDFIIEGAGHVDLLYGKSANEIIHPLIYEIVEKTWNNWSYENIPVIPQETILSQSA